MKAEIEELKSMNATVSMKDVADSQVKLTIK